MKATATGRAAVRPGQAVEPGAKLGLTGNTGLSSGPHLHYEILSGRPATRYIL